MNNSKIIFVRHEDGIDFRSTDRTCVVSVISGDRESQNRVFIFTISGKTISIGTTFRNDDFDGNINERSAVWHIDKFFGAMPHAALRNRHFKDLNFISGFESIEEQDFFLEVIRGAFDQIDFHKRSVNQNGGAGTVKFSKQINDSLSQGEFVR